jgi:hypothetical protein
MRVMTLTEAAEFTNKAVKFIGIPITLIIVIWFIIRIITTGPNLPDKYITPDYLCGQLPGLELSSFELEAPTRFSVETTSGAIPDLPEVVNVYKFAHPGQSLLALQESQRTADLLGFEPDSYTRISTTEYEWYNAEMKQTLVIETGNQNLSLTTDFTDPSVTTNSRSLPSEQQAKTVALQYLQQADLLYRDYSQGEQKTYLIQITANGEFREAPSLAEADLVRVDFFREKYLITVDPDLAESEELGSTLQEELVTENPETLETEEGAVQVKTYSTTVYNDSPKFGNITVFVGGRKEDNTRGDFQIYGIEYKNWIIGPTACGTYKLISPQEAVRRVQEGDGALVHLLENGEDQIIPYETKDVTEMTILDVSLGYLDTAQKQLYLQPIFVIRGEANFGNDVYGDFYYYVPAVDYESIPENAGETQEPEEPEQPEEGLLE